jgi:hypothetical protein
MTDTKFKADYQTHCQRIDSEKRKRQTVQERSKHTARSNSKLILPLHKLTSLSAGITNALEENNFRIFLAKLNIFGVNLVKQDRKSFPNKNSNNWKVPVDVK